MKTSAIGCSTGGLQRAGAQVYGSYTRFLVDLAVFIVKAWSRDGRSLPLALPVS